jgi:hypothetical protein
MTPAETRPAIRSDDHTLQPGGRWERILTAIAHQSLTIGGLLRSTNPGKHHHRAERHRILRALVIMSHAGLVTRIDGWGWTATAEGREALEALDLARAASPAVLAQTASRREASDSAQTRAQAARDRVPSDSAQTSQAA